MSKRGALTALVLLGSLVEMAYVYLYWQMHIRMLTLGYVVVTAPSYLWLEILLLYPVMLGTPVAAIYLILTKTPSP